MNEGEASRHEQKMERAGGALTQQPRYAKLFGVLGVVEILLGFQAFGTSEVRGLFGVFGAPGIFGVLGVSGVFWSLWGIWGIGVLVRN